MNQRVWQIIGVFFILCIYPLMFYLLLMDKFKVDFSSFYSSAIALKQGANPYDALVADYLPIPRLLSNNLCPPAFLWLFRPLSALSYQSALTIWCFLSLLAGLIGAGISFSLAYTKNSLHQYGFSLFLIYLMLFPTIMNLSVGQLGSILFLLTMLGYYYYLQQRDYLVGVLWGIIISIKFFPALLFFYVLRERRFNVFFTMVLVCIGSWLIPLLVYGTKLYQDYFNLMFHISWYGDSWNAGINGFLFRLFTHSYSVPDTVRLEINLLYLAIFLVVLGLYCRLLYTSTIKKERPIDHYRFCLTLIFMLLLSPLSWIYYFSLLIFPLALIWSKVVNTEHHFTIIFGLWLLSIVLLNIPVDYVRICSMPHFLSRATLYSLHFYGLLLLSYLLIRERNLQAPQPLIVTPMVTTMMPILIFGASIPLASFVMTALFY